jgi:hypothetical protein
VSVPAKAERAASADAALMAYMSRTRCDCEDCLSGLLRDLMHWADKSGLSFREALYGALFDYAVDAAEDEAS